MPVLAGRLPLLALAAAVASPGCALVRALGGDDEPGADSDAAPGDGDADGGGGGSIDGGAGSADAADCAPAFFEGFSGTELDADGWFFDGPDPVVADGSLTISFDGDTDGNVATRISTNSFYVHRADVELTVTQTGEGEALVSWDSGTARYGLLAADGELRAIDASGPLCDPCPALESGLQVWSLVPADEAVELRVGSTLVGTAPAEAGEYRLEILGDVDGAGDQVDLEVRLVAITDCGG